MVSITSEYGLYLYPGKVDMRKGIDGLCGIISAELKDQNAKLVDAIAGMRMMDHRYNIDRPSGGRVLLRYGDTELYTDEEVLVQHPFRADSKR